MERNTKTSLTKERSIPDEPLSVTTKTFVVLTDAMREFDHPGITLELEVTDWGDDDPDRVELCGRCDDIGEELFSCGATSEEAFCSLEDHVSAAACQLREEVVRRNPWMSTEYQNAVDLAHSS
jgi:hypothetical protein